MEFVTGISMQLWFGQCGRMFGLLFWQSFLPFKNPFIPKRTEKQVRDYFGTTLKPS